MTSARPITVATYNMRKAIGTDRRRNPLRVLQVLGEIDADVVAPGQSVTYTVTALQYFYPGAPGLSYVELQSKVEKEIGPATVEAEVAYTPQQDNAADSLYTAVGASVEGPRQVTAFARVGRENGAYSRKWDWELGLRREFGPLSVSVSYVATNHRAASLGKDGKPTLLLAAGVEF